MVKIVQFGEGNFLRTFVDLYFDTLNKKGYDYKVNIVKPITFGSLDNFVKQQNKYHIVLRGVENGKTSLNVYKVDVLENVLSPFEDMEKYYSLAREDELKIIVSNTTEAGICFNENDSIDDFEVITYPAKLTKFLLERYNAKKEGVYLLPVELIDNNADQLKICVDKYIKLWNLPDEFKEWNDTQNFYCN
ncbi:MAG: tagaturonate reductase, partial [Clostridia bacterium]|nr:tagaturonate reductase [Clostridia bacterium]